MTAYLQLPRLADEAGLRTIAPDGTTGPEGLRFWNATPSCCDFGHSGVDDVAYLTGLIREISREWNVDPKRVYVIGQSNGGFMGYRLACEHAELIAGVVSMAGAMPMDSSVCHPGEPVSVLQIHGDADQRIPYNGGTNFRGFAQPGALDDVRMWSEYGHCSGMLAPGGEDVDLERSLPGAETVRQHDPGCLRGVDVALWTIRGGGHIPGITDSFRSIVWEWMRAHPKPG
jgi:polyhydroxybutyrate depolymerase